MSESENFLQEAARLRKEQELATWSPALDWMTSKAVDREEERDELLNMLGKVCILTEAVIEGDATASEEVYLRELIKQAFWVMGSIIENKQREISNVQMDRLNNPELDAIYRSAGL